MPSIGTQPAALALLAVSLAVLDASAAAADVTPSGAPCTATEAQNWWVPTPGKTGGSDFGHVHLGACTPDEQTVKGVTVVHLKVQLHDNPSTIDYVSGVVKTDGNETTVVKD